MFDTAAGQAIDGASLGKEALLIVAKGVLMLLAVALLIRYVLPRLLHRLARSPELLMLCAIASAISTNPRSAWSHWSA
jgi:Kef-type K+ transport system membrane component KefB